MSSNRLSYSEYHPFLCSSATAWAQVFSAFPAQIRYSSWLCPGHNRIGAHPYRHQTMQVHHGPIPPGRQLKALLSRDGFSWFWEPPSARAWPQDDAQALWLQLLRPQLELALQQVQPLAWQALLRAGELLQPAPACA